MAQHEKTDDRTDQAVIKPISGPTPIDTPIHRETRPVPLPPSLTSLTPDGGVMELQIRRSITLQHEVPIIGVIELQDCRLITLAWPLIGYGMGMVGHGCAMGWVLAMGWPCGLVMDWSWVGHGVGHGLVMGCP